MELSLRSPRIASSSILTSHYVSARYIGTIYIARLRTGCQLEQAMGTARSAWRAERVSRLPGDVTGPPDRLGWGGLANPRPHVGGGDTPQPRLADRPGRQGDPDVNRPESLLVGMAVVPHGDGALEPRRVRHLRAGLFGAAEASGHLPLDPRNHDALGPHRSGSSHGHDQRSAHVSPAEDRGEARRRRRSPQVAAVHPSPRARRGTGARRRTLSHQRDVLDHVSEPP